MIPGISISSELPMIDYPHLPAANEMILVVEPFRHVP